MFERFHDQSRRAVVYAQEEARLLGDEFIGSQHLLLGLLANTPYGTASRLLADLGLSHTELRREFAPAERSDFVSGHIPFTPDAKATLEQALRESQRLDDVVIRPEHLVLGMAAQGTGRGAEVLLRAAGSLDQLRARYEALRAERAPAAEEPVGLGRRPRVITGRGIPGGPLQEILERLTAIEERLAGIECRLGDTDEASLPPRARQ